MDILIGREEGTARLMVVSPQGKVALGQPHSVPNSVSRLLAAQGQAHCKLVVDANGGMTIHNMKATNVTCVDGVPVQSKRITNKSVVTLGQDNYRVDLQAILKATQGTKCDIRKMERVYQEYEEKLDAIAAKQQKMAKIRMAPMVLSALSGVLTTVLAATQGASTMAITLPVTIIIVVIWIALLLRKNTSVEQKKAAQDWLVDHYVCPSTGKFLGNKSYKVLKQEDKCPHCKGDRVS